MGSLAGHISAFLLLLPVGLHRLSSAINLLLRSPNPPFRSRPWHLSDHPVPHLRLLGNADLYALLLALPIGAFSHLFLLSTLHRVPFALHAAVLSLFFLLLLLHAVTAPSSLLVPDDLVFFLGAMAFLAEYGLSDGLGEGVVEARVRQLTSAVTLACAGACLVLTVRRSAVAADVGFALGLVMKGTWALQEGVMLYAVPPEGCRLRKEGFGGLVCALEEHQTRGVAVVELMFAVHAAAATIACVGMYWLLVRREKRSSAELEVMITRPIMNAVQFETD